MKRSYFALIMCMTLLVAACGGGETGQETVSEVKIGVLLPLSGASADYGSKLRQHIQFAADEVNGAGGIKSLGGARLELVFADTQSLPDIGQTETERLILQENVSGLIGCFNSSVTLVCTQAAERHQIPTVVYSSVAEEITQRGLKYTFRPNETSLGAVNTMFAFIDDQVQSTGSEPVTFASVVENTDFGTDVAANFIEQAEAKGWEKVVDEAYQPGLADATPIALKLKSEEPDLLIMATVPPDTNRLFETFTEQGVEPPVVMEFAGAATREFDPILGDNNEMFQVGQWNEALTAARPWLQDHIDAFAAQEGIDIQPEGLQGYSNVWIWADALERAGSLDKEAIRAALAATNITEDSENPALMMPYPQISFGPDGQNPDATLMILQVSEGERVPVWPESLRPADYTVQWMS